MCGADRSSRLMLDVGSKSDEQESDVVDKQEPNADAELSNHDGASATAVISVSRRAAS